MRASRWKVIVKWVGAVLLVLAVAWGALWLVAWAIVQNDRERTPPAYQDPP